MIMYTARSGSSNFYALRRASAPSCDSTSGWIKTGVNEITPGGVPGTLDDDGVAHPFLLGYPGECVRLYYTADENAATSRIFSAKTTANSDGDGQTACDDPDDDNDGMLDDYEGANACLDPLSDDAAADPDADGLSSLQEYGLGTEPCISDTDGDLCIDGAETDVTSGSESTGGKRDPLNPWDFYDVLGPGAALPTDGVIDLANDILGVIQHFAPLSGGAPPYDVRFDRGPQIGPNTWNMSAPDGVIDLANDILGVILQFSHNCAQG